MTHISITTTQNVTIDYALASFQRRLMAFFIDLLVILAWIMLQTFIGLSVMGGGYLGNIYLWLVIVPFFSFYTLMMEYFMNGQTPGKRTMNIRVVMLNGKEPSFIDYFIRWSLRFVEIYLSSGVLASIMINTTNLKQRLADTIAGTVLVQIHVFQSIAADDLSKISSHSNYEPVYPQVTMFSENDMLTIKKLVDRYFNYRNEAHRHLVTDTARQLSQKMGVNVREDKPELFLKALIRDYVVLTR